MKQLNQWSFADTHGSLIDGFGSGRGEGSLLTFVLIDRKFSGVL